MSAAENKELIRDIWAEAGKGSIDGFLNGFADDVHYTIIGTTKFSGIFKGKQDLLSRAFMPLMSELESPGSMVTDNLIAEGDYVVQQGHGIDRKTKSGEPYNNTYCFVYKVVGGKVKEVTEYADTELVTRAFGK
ncbi:MAG: nuclear transport factor 2 family protein [Candidatus Binataceae bacterium]